MVQTIEATKKLIIHFDCYDDIPDGNYIAWIEGKDYAGMVVTGNSVPECLKELSISLNVLEIYRKNLLK